MISMLRVFLRTGGLLLLAAISTAAFAQRPVPGFVAFGQRRGAGPPHRSFVAGELVVWVKAGAGTQADVQAAAQKVGATVERPLRMANVYLLQMLVDNKPVPDAQVQAAVAQLKQNAMFRWVGTNRYYFPDDSTPNDPMYPQQWHLPLMNMPKAWDLQKGQSGVVIADVDTGCDVTHPDLASRIMGFQNFATPSTPTNVTDTLPHGTHTAGIAAAVTNNGTGVAGVTWQNVQLYIAKAVDATNTFPLSALVDAVTFIRQSVHTGGVQVVMNMSLGAPDVSDQPDLTDPFNQAVLGAAGDGIIVSISAGNDDLNGNPPENPANLAPLSPNILCVAACGPNKEHAVYSSSRPTTTITAPGGDDPTGANPAAEVLSTFPVAMGSYGREQGTSMAAPCITGVAALLLSSGAPPGIVKSILTSTANPLGQAVPNNDFGWGLVDAFAALNALESVTIITPQGTGGKANNNLQTPAPVETERPIIDIQVRQIIPANLTITIDNGTPIPQAPATDCPNPPLTSPPEYCITNVTATVPDPNNPTGPPLPSSYDAVISNIILAPGQHTINVSGTSPGPPTKTVTDTRTFTITPHLIPAGRSMISIPYFEYVDAAGNVANDTNTDPNGTHITPQTYFGTDFRLTRWDPNLQQYVFYSSFGAMDPRASFTPPDIIPHLDGDPATPAFAKWPLGLGYWSDTSSAKPVLTKGEPIVGRSMVIPLTGTSTAGASISWNMIGDPFPFDIPFNSLLVDTPAGRLSIAVAVAQGYLLPTIYSFDGQNGYTFRSLPDGALFAWTGHWVGVTSAANISLVVPPAGNGQAAPATQAISRATAPATGSGGWTLQLSAHSGSLHDAYNFIGVSRQASDSYNRSDVAKPPMVSPYLSLGINHSDWGKRSGLYAQDIRSATGSKSWNIVVSTDQPNSDVTLTWNSAVLPRTVKLLIKDETTGQTTDMRTRSSIAFNTGTNLAPRQFTITSQLVTGGGFVRIGGVNVRSNPRSTANVIGFNLSGDGTYDVEILNISGRTITPLATRAVATGDVRIVWNGRDAAGRSVPAGTYLVRIRATGSGGDQATAIQPLVIVR